jgi:hypothetical protein
LAITNNAEFSNAKTPSAQTLRGLDWLNFFLADVQTGVGPFLAIYLAGYGWNEESVGMALTVGGIAGILTQTPAGGLVDRLRSKRALIAAGIVALAVGALLTAFIPTFWSVMSAQVLIGGTASIFGPAIRSPELAAKYAINWKAHLDHSEKHEEKEKGYSETHRAATEPPKVDAAVPIAGGFVASARSPVFHRPDCKSAAKISAKNLVHYNSRDEAIQAGKKPCAECSP